MDVNLDAPVQAAQAQKGQLNSLFAGQRGENTDFLGRYKSLLGGQETTAQTAQRLGESVGLHQLQQNATMLRNTLTNLPSTYSGATRGFDVNNNQLQRIITQKTSDLAPAVDTAERSLQNAQGTVNTQLGYSQADKDRQLLPFQSEQSIMGEQQARETTGYTHQMDNELSALIQKMQSGVTLSEGEKNRANQLAMAEKEFEHTKELNKQQAELSGSSSNPYVSLSEGQTLYNTMTGQPLYKNPKTYQASSGSSGW